MTPVLGTSDGEILTTSGGDPIEVSGHISAILDLPGAPYQRIASHADEAVELLLHQFRMPRIEAMLRALVAPLQRFEDVLWQLLTRAIPLDIAQGAQLDVWGRILRAPRAGLGDDAYRLQLRVRSLALRSHGRAEEIYAILRLAFGEGVDVVILELYPATILIDVGTPLEVDSWLYSEVIRAAKAGGVRLVFVTNPGDSEDVFTWDTTPPGESGTIGWGSTSDPSLGGVWASAIAV